MRTRGPFKVAPTKRGPRPRATIWLALPRSMPADRPGRRASDSAIVVSGSLPMFSEAIISTMLLLASLASSALRVAARMPVTTTVSRLVAGAVGDVEVWALTAAGSTNSDCSSSASGVLRLLFGMFLSP